MSMLVAVALPSRDFFKRSTSRVRRDQAANARVVFLGAKSESARFEHRSQTAQLSDERLRLFVEFARDALRRVLRDVDYGVDICQ